MHLYGEPVLPASLAYIEGARLQSCQCATIPEAATFRVNGFDTNAGTPTAFCDQTAAWSRLWLAAVSSYSYGAATDWSAVV